MKKELATTIIAAIAGVLIAYFVTNIFIPPTKNFTYSSVDSSIGADYIEPDVEIFNYKALNPTVEVFVGNCTEYNENGECVDNIDSENTQIPEIDKENTEEIIEDVTEEIIETPNNESSTEENYEQKEE